MTTRDGTESAEVGYTVTLTGDGVSVDKVVDHEVALEIMALALGGRAPSGKAKTPEAKRARKKVDSDGLGAGKPRRKKTGSFAVVKDLSMRPQGKQPFKAFAEEKAPATHQQKLAVIVDWLKREAGIDEVTGDHVNTCYVEAGWKRPADLANALQVTATRKGWLDTSDMSNIQLTSRGEDLVNHDLPPEPKQ